MTDELLRSLVWTDYRLAVLFAVLVPLALLVWAAVKKAEAIQRLLVIYWRVSSLLAITVYLMIGGLPLSFISALAARILIPVGLWFWADLNEEIDDQRRTPIKLTFTAWRWAMTVYMGLGAIAQLLTLPCAVSQTAFAGTTCQVWLEAPLIFREFFHGGSSRGFLGFWGIVGLVIYVIYLGYFVFVRLNRQGRSAVQD
ncbi:MAG: DUF3177 family protein [Leptolyngbya sp. DLM2.Bin15]|nr:MAG: DUF3177 family protein [Leptolyngbya sp. DLM2.Bin15]